MAKGDPNRRPALMPERSRQRPGPDDNSVWRVDVTKPEWGTKRTCQSCSAHFYDLRKDPIHCPKCGATYDPEAILKSRRRAPEKVAPVPVKPVKPVAEELPDVEADAEAEESAEEADDVIEDTSELGEDDADIPETIEPSEEER
jgi:uncharacterized protein (TIGR02300 family)